MRRIVVIVFFLLFINVLGAEAIDKAVSVIVNGKQVAAGPQAFMSEGRVFVPVRSVAEELGATVDWNEGSGTVTINNSGSDAYLKGQINNQGGSPSITNDLISATDLRNMLDDDKDSDLADYRQGHNGGDSIANDPLVVDVRKQEDYNASHIPGAVWIAPAGNMAEPASLARLKELLDQHKSAGGKNEIVLYCYTGNTSGLVAGALGSMGLPVKSMMYGFDIAWRGTKFADSAIKAKMEDSGGKTIECGG